MNIKIMNKIIKKKIKMIKYTNLNKKIIKIKLNKKIE